MRIAYVCVDAGVPVFGKKGCSIHLREMINALKSQGIIIDLFANSLDGEPPREWETIRIHPLHLPEGETAIREKAALSSNDHLRATLQTEGPFEMVYERYSLWSFAAMEYAREAGIPGVLEVNAPLIDEQARYRKLVDRANAEACAARVFAAATVLIAVSREVGEYLFRFSGTKGRVHVLSNGVNPNHFPRDQRSKLDSDPGCFTIGFVGSLKPWHGVSVLLDAFSMLHHREANSRLLIVGDGPERPTLMNQIAEHGLQHSVHFTGPVDHARIPALLASMDVAVAPYTGHDPFYFSPLKVFEYMAAALPVVASGIGQIREIIRDEENGLLVSPGDPAALLTALDRLRKDVSLRSRLGDAARSSVLRFHTWDSIAKRVLTLAGLDQKLHAGNLMVKN